MGGGASSVSREPKRQRAASHPASKTGKEAKSQVGDYQNGASNPNPMDPSRRATYNSKSDPSLPPIVKSEQKEQKPNGPILLYKAGQNGKKVEDDAKSSQSKKTEKETKKDKKEAEKGKKEAEKEAKKVEKAAAKQLSKDNKAPSIKSSASSDVVPSSPLHNTKKRQELVFRLFRTRSFHSHVDKSEEAEEQLKRRKEDEMGDDDIRCILAKQRKQTENAILLMLAREHNNASGSEMQNYDDYDAIKQEDDHPLGQSMVLDMSTFFSEEVEETERHTPKNNSPAKQAPPGSGGNRGKRRISHADDYCDLHTSPLTPATRENLSAIYDGSDPQQTVYFEEEKKVEKKKGEQPQPQPQPQPQSPQQQQWKPAPPPPTNMAQPIARQPYNTDDTSTSSPHRNYPRRAISPAAQSPRGMSPNGMSPPRGYVAQRGQFNHQNMVDQGRGAAGFNDTKNAYTVGQTVTDPYRATGVTAGAATQEEAVRAQEKRSYKYKATPYPQPNFRNPPVNVRDIQFKRAYFKTNKYCRYDQNFRLVELLGYSLHRDVPWVDSPRSSMDAASI